MSSNPSGNGFTGGGGGSVVGNTGGVSAQKVVLAKILEKQNEDFDNKLQQAEGADDKQQNVAMMKPPAWRVTPGTAEPPMKLDHHCWHAETGTSSRVRWTRMSAAVPACLPRAAQPVC